MKTEGNAELTGKDLKVLFVSSSGKVFKLIPFIKSQFESIQHHLKKADHYNIKGSGIKAYISSYKDLKEKLRNENFDIIHAHWTYAGIICMLLTKREKLVISFMGNDLQGIYTKKFNILTLKGLVNILLSQYLLFKTDAIIVKSNKMLRWVPSYFRHKSEVIPNGVNLNKFKAMDQSVARSYLNLDPNQKYIAFLADTRDQNKNFDLLNKSSLLLKKANVDHKILTPYPIHSSEIPFYLAAADVLAFPSKLEGSPNIIKEALAMGCPIVATDVGDIRERIGDIKGCYVSTFNKRDFSIKLTAALTLNKRIDTTHHLTEISEDTIANKIIALYKKILSLTPKKVITG